MRSAALICATVMLVALVLVAAGMAAPPLGRSCDPAVEAELCSATVDAALQRGLGPIHPLILSGHVVPGPAAGPAMTGHEATVIFDLLGMPGRTEVKMFTDMGGHWGGAVDRSDEEIAAWALSPLLVAGLLSVGIVALAWRRRSGATG